MTAFVIRFAFVLTLTAVWFASFHAACEASKFYAEVCLRVMSLQLVLICCPHAMLTAEGPDPNTPNSLF